LSAHSTLSAIIITHGRIDRLRLAVAGCVAQAPPLEELIIVDDAGALDVPELAASDRVAPRWVRGERRGRAAARNAGARLAAGDVLLFLDDDVVIGSGFAAAHRAAQVHRPGICRGRIRELIAAAVVRDFGVGAPGFPPLDADAVLAGRFEPAHYRQLTSVLERAVEDRFLSQAELPAWLAGCGANFSIAKRDWLRLGGQDEQFGTRWGCEDLELSLRAVCAGVSLSFVPEAVAYHLSHVQSDRWVEHAHSLALFARLHPIPEVVALGALLGPHGSTRAYLDAISERARQ
jgi:GT2 family glycosyltransferase